MNDSNPMESSPQLFAPDSLVKTSHAREGEKESTARDRDCSLRLSDSFARYDPSSSSWRTSQYCLDGDLAKFSESFPRSGLMRSGIVYRLVPLALLTAGIESGSSLIAKPTATANQLCPSMMKHAGCRNMLPTPTTQEIEHPSAEICPKSGRRLSKDGKSTHSLNLADTARMWPTPTARDYKDTAKDWRNLAKYEHKKRLACSVASQGQTSGQLNPTWVEWLMGYPGGWTDLDHSETPSSRKSSNKSGDQ